MNLKHIKNVLYNTNKLVVLSSRPKVIWDFRPPHTKFLDTLLIETIYKEENIYYY